jgi:hypothetical protein
MKKKPVKKPAKKMAGLDKLAVLTKGMPMKSGKPAAKRAKKAMY